MAVTAQQIIYKSLRLLGVLASGEAPSAAEMQDSLYSLNSLIDSINANSQYYYYTGDEIFSLQSGQAAYAIGNTSVAISSLTRALSVATVTTIDPHGLETGNRITVSGATQTDYNVTAAITVTSLTTFTYAVANNPATPATGTPVFTTGDFSVSRPIRIVGGFTRSGSVDSSIGLITEQYWNNIADKTAASNPPVKLLYRPSAPFGQIILYPTPTSSPPTLHLRAERTIYQYGDFTDTQFLPPGYQRLLELMLAVELAPEYGSRASPETIAYLKTSLADVTRTNIQKLPASKIGAIPATNIYTDVTTVGGVIPQPNGGIA
jgi:hypothetical protein